MKAYPIILILLLSLFVSSCADSITDIGKGIQPSTDQISIGTDIFHVSTNTLFVDSIVLKPDSFLLGTFYDTKFGTIKADILAQVDCPVGYKFNPNAKVDSAKIILSYRSCFGDTLAPLDINIYEMDKQTFLFSGVYPSNLNPLDYTTLNKKLGERIIRSGQNSTYGKNIEFRLDTNSLFVKGLRDDTHFKSNDAFNQFFGGMYINTKFGASTLLNLGSINLIYYFHYTYPTKNINGRDSTAIVNDKIPFSANSWVRQVNRIQYPDRKTVVKLSNDKNYLASPVNLQTQVVINLDSIQKKLNAGINGKKLTINSALLRVDITDTEQDTILHPVVKYVLLVKESAINRFFNNKESPSDTCSVLAHYTTNLITGTTNTYEHYYTFSLAKLIANELKRVPQGSAIKPLNLRLIPVAVNTATSSNGSVTISSVKQQFLMNAATILSGSNTTSPMRLKMVYSGF
jgi:hypothetical protein